jgi:hypothetical protein
MAEPTPKPKFTPNRNLQAARCIRLCHDIELAGEWRGGAKTTSRAFYPPEEPGLTIERKAGLFLFSQVGEDGKLYEVEVPTNHIHSIVYAAVSPDPEEK